MTLHRINPTGTSTWNRLKEHFKEIESKHLKDLFKEEPLRAAQLTIQWEDFYVDFSKNRMNGKTMELLLKLADDLQLSEAIEAQFNGAIINETEGRAVLHTALRAKKDAKVLVDGKNVIPGIYEVRDQIKTFSEKGNHCST
jgi:glucose-6-phosphate isomerase